MSFRKQVLKQKVSMNHQGISTSSEAITADGATVEDEYLDAEQSHTSSSSALCLCDPISWNHYFDTQEMITIEGTENQFRVYETSVQNPSATLVMLHGAGHSALSWALATKELKKLSYRVLAIDMRAHGGTATTNDSDLSVETLCKDVIDAIEQKYGESKASVVLVGHSMGGAIAAKISARDLASEGKRFKLQGVVVIDVVEGTAMEALGSMHNIITARPTQFPSIESAIEWSLRSNMLRNSESARVSVPSLLVRCSEEGTVKWRTDLLSSEKYWTGWFDNLSNCFLASKCPRLLILAGTDRLDKTLTIAQMQGKFQLALLPQAGHVIQEDAPHRVAHEIHLFVERTKPLDIAALLAKAKAAQ
eukprot:TRINITY_DN5164_c0_g1_i1.p1 TRINITY_DN5164_c0_g1~~TRINITY_DN5164_c0_g1_i1.p1  ORF type:complete len:363 (+),score=53.41 TRINITY_DN5164_c0_g1_i1:118-1206(+)